VIPVEFETAHSTLFRQLLKIRKQHKPKREPAAEFDSFFGRLPPCSDETRYWGSSILGRENDLPIMIEGRHPSVRILQTQ